MAQGPHRRLAGHTPLRNLRLREKSWILGVIAGKNVRYLHPLEHGGAVGHVGERVDVGVDRVLVHLLGPMGRAEIQVCGKKRWEGEGRGSCTPIENEER